MLFLACNVSSENEQFEKWEEQAGRVTITRDKWGVAHVNGETDADAVFGMMYAQCEENFPKVENNYIEKLGRWSELKGGSHLYSDLLMRLLFDSAAAKKDYHDSPGWLKKLLDAFADGVNYFLYKNPQVKPKLLTRFEPWYPLLFTDGGYTALQTGGLEMQDMKSMYQLAEASSGFKAADPFFTSPPTGSNAFAIGPAKSKGGNAMLYINPHVSFYFRTEMHVSSREGLNVYGAVTWGQFFIYQGFNEHCGWMHTSSQADAADLYAEKIIKRGDSIFYEYDGTLKPVLQKFVSLNVKNGETIKPFVITTWSTHHGPVLGARGQTWLTLKANNRSLQGLIQSWERTKATSLAEFTATMQRRTNSSTNTMYADGKGNIAYWHGNFLPRRDTAYNFSGAVPGDTNATEWKGVHELHEIASAMNPPIGWLQNCNSSPFNVAGPNVIDRNRYPFYMAPDKENFRSLYAIRELRKSEKYNLDELIAFGYDSYLSVFDSLLPPLFTAYEKISINEPLSVALQGPIDSLRNWNRRSSRASSATTLAIEWAYYLINDGYAKKIGGDQNDQVALFSLFINSLGPRERLEMLRNVVEGLERAYGSWKIPWGEINRYQRTADGEEFDPGKPSEPVGLASALFGCLPAYESAWQNDGKGYGIAGNSFVAAVEFGKKIRAKSVITGGQSFDPSSPHFNDQSAMFLSGNFKDVLFYRDDILNNAVRTYHPGR